MCLLSVFDFCAYFIFWKVEKIVGKMSGKEKKFPCGEELIGLSFVYWFYMPIFLRSHKNFSDMGLERISR